MAKNNGLKTAKTKEKNRKIQVFAFAAPTATLVQLAGSFTQWQQAPIKMEKGADGIWQTTVPLEEGAHLYRFLVDGQWHDDPKCGVSVPNPFGSQDAIRQVV